MLKVPDRSPPVPQVSNTAPGGGDRTALARIVCAKPTSSVEALAFHAEANQQTGNLRRGRLAAHDRHRRGRFCG